jgi:hypothetical protein
LPNFFQQSLLHRIRDSVENRHVRYPAVGVDYEVPDAEHLEVRRAGLRREVLEESLQRIRVDARG